MHSKWIIYAEKTVFEALITYSVSSLTYIVTPVTCIVMMITLCFTSKNMIFCDVKSSIWLQEFLF